VRQVATLLISISLTPVVSCGGNDGDSPTAPTPTPMVSFVSFVSSPGDGVGQGQTRRIESGPAATFGGDMWDGNNALSLTILTPGPGARDWGLQLAAPKGRTLTPGVYKNARRIPAIGSAEPQLNFGGEQRSCNTSTGEFEVLEAVYGPKPQGSGTSGTIDRLHARFTQTCDGSSGALTGEVWLVSVPRFCKVSNNC
jgi:hypothetical protein